MDMQNAPKEPKTSGKKRSERRGFYLALAVCLAAIGIAAWSTYDTVSNFLAPEETGAAASLSATERPSATHRPASALPDTDPESRTAAGHGAGTGPAVTLTPAPQPTEAPQPEQEPAQDPEVPAEETAAAPETEPGEFLWPVASGEVLAAYTDAPVYSETMRDYRAHLGTDIAAEHGETVRAAAAGTVRETASDLLRGNFIVIEHGSYELTYCGLGETFLVEPGETVEAGQAIGSVTAAPYESAMPPHLHLEARQDGAALDPASLLK